MRPFSLRVAIVVFGAAVLTTLAVPAMARADAVTQWNANANAAILASNPTAHSSVLSSAMVQGAVYDAVNGIVGGYKPYLVSPAVNPWDSTDAAVATAAYRVLLSVVPASQTAALATLAAQYTAALAAVPAGAAKDGGIAAGEAAAAAMLAARTNDGRNPTTPFPFVFGTTPGVWRVTPPLTTPDPTAWVGNVKPFLVPDVEMLRTKGPNDLTSKKYAKDLNEVEVARRIREHDANAGRDQRRDLLAIPAAVPLGRARALAVATLRAQHGRQCTPLRRGQPRRGGRGDRLLERQVLLELLAAGRRDPSGRYRRQPGRRPRIRPGGRSSIPQRRPFRRSRLRTSRITRPATAASPVRR